MSNMKNHLDNINEQTKLLIEQEQSEMNGFYKRVEHTKQHKEMIAKMQTKLREKMNDPEWSEKVGMSIEPQIIDVEAKEVN